MSTSNSVLNSSDADFISHILNSKFITNSVDVQLSNDHDDDEQSAKITEKIKNDALTPASQPGKSSFFEFRWYLLNLTALFLRNFFGIFS